MMHRVRRVAMFVAFVLVPVAACDSEPGPRVTNTRGVPPRPATAGASGTTTSATRDPTTEPKAPTRQYLPSPARDVLPLVGELGVDEHGYPRQLPDLIALRALLLERRFDELEFHFRAYQAQFERDHRFERWPDRAIDAFASADPRLQPPLTEWSEAKPDSYAARAALGAHREALAWRERGTATATETGPERMAAFDAGEREATAAFERAVELEPGFVAGYRRLLNIAGHNSDDAATLTRYVDAALQHCPDCVSIHATYMRALAPRWGGSYERMQAYATEHRKRIAKNPRMALLEATMYLERCEEQVRAEDNEAALPLCTKAIEIWPEAGPLAERARIYLNLGELDLAEADVVEGLTRWPQDEELLQRKYGLHTHRNQGLEAGQALLTLYRLDPRSTWLEERLPKLKKHLRMEADGYYRGGFLERAKLINELLLEFDPDDRQARGFAAETTPPENLDELRALVAANPEGFEARQQLDAALLRIAAFDEIIAMWDEYIERHPQEVRAILERAGTKQFAGRYPEAVEDFDKACGLGEKRACSRAARGREAIANPPKK